jgi:hypothetical protein
MLAGMTDTGKTRAQELLGDTAPDLVRLTDAAEQMYKQLAITADDIAEVIAFAVTHPRRMTINEILVNGRWVPLDLGITAVVDAGLPAARSEGVRSARASTRTPWLG